MFALEAKSRWFESNHSDKLTGCNSVGRELGLEPRGRWSESSHPDISVCNSVWSESSHRRRGVVGSNPTTLTKFGIGRSYLAQVRAFDLSSKGCYGPPFAWLAQLALEQMFSNHPVGSSNLSPGAKNPVN